MDRESPINPPGNIFQPLYRTHPLLMCRIFLSFISQLSPVPSLLHSQSCFLIIRLIKIFLLVSHYHHPYYPPSYLLPGLKSRLLPFGRFRISCALFSGEPNYKVVTPEISHAKLINAVNSTGVPTYTISLFETSPISLPPARCTPAT